MQNIPLTRTANVFSIFEQMAKKHDAVVPTIIMLHLALVFPCGLQMAGVVRSCGIAVRKPNFFMPHFGNFIS